MLCARCARKVAAGASECPNCGGDPSLAGRYRLERELAGDSLGSSYRATRIADRATVRARACMLRHLDRRFDRELGLARLRALEHPALPRRLDELQTGEGSLASVWLIDEHVEGITLAEAIAAAPSHRLDQARVLAVLRELASLLAYLHRQPTPVVHGALTPASLMLRPDGRALLLDLGLASGAVHGAGSRGIAERLHFTAPEQLYADAGPASDVWALGAAAVAALAGVRLSALRDSGSTLRWRDHVDVEPQLATLLERMLEPDPHKRIRAGELVAALAELDVKPQPTHHHPWTPPKPTLERTSLPPPSRATKPVRAQPGRQPDVPVLRPEELSRELSQAQQVAVALEHQQRAQLILARLLVVVLAAVIAALITYIALTGR